MVDAQSSQNTVEALALTGASTVVTAMGTDAWSAVRDGLARLFDRHDRSRKDVVLATLDDNEALFSRSHDPAEARAALAPLWTMQFRQLLDAHSQAVADLRALVDEMRPKLSQPPRQIVQNNTAHGGSTIFAVVDGNLNVRSGQEGTSVPDMSD